MHNFGIAIHGGAGAISKSKLTPEKDTLFKGALQVALQAGYDALANGKSSLAAVEAAVVELENCPLFNAGKGAVFNAQGKHEMDASIMDGKTLQAGAIAAVPNVKNPVKLAHKVLTNSNHVLLIGQGALDFSKAHDIELEDDEYFFNEYRYKQWQKIKDSDEFVLDHVDKEKQYLGTVGAVALDKHGNVAAATSTGGMTNKKFGRVGDSPLIGLGNYANNNTCAVSCTGSGEFFMRAVTAYDISCLMEYKNLTLHQAAEEAVNQKLLKLGGDGGVIAIDAAGNIAMPFNCEGMYRGSKNESHELVAIH